MTKHHPAGLALYVAPSKAGPFTHFSACGWSERHLLGGSVAMARKWGFSHFRLLGIEPDDAVIPDAIEAHEGEPFSFDDDSEPGDLADRVLIGAKAIAGGVALTVFVIVLLWLSAGLEQPLWQVQP